MRALRLETTGLLCHGKPRDSPLHLFGPEHVFKLHTQINDLTGPTHQAALKGQGHRVIAKNPDSGITDSWVHISSPPLSTYPL